MNDAVPTTEPPADHDDAEQDEWYAAFDGKDTLAFVLTVLGAVGVLVGSLLDWGPAGSEFRSWFFENSAASLLLAIAVIVLAIVAYMTVESWLAWVGAASAAVVVGIAVTNIVDIYQASGDISPKFGLWWVLVDGVFAFVCSVWLAVGLLDRVIDLNRAVGNTWLAGARPKTLPAAVVPVAVGTAAVWEDAIWWRALLALVVSVAIQVGTNYANDYSDGVRGTDGPDRVGPVRLVGSGLATARSVKIAAQVAFGVAAVAGVALCAVAGWWLLAVGAVSLLAGWYYTGGSRPYGYLGFGELFVFVFFGLVATIGSAYVHTESFDGLRLAILSSIPVGLLAVSLMLTNNLRDRPADAAVGENTLAVRLGDRNTRWLFAGIFALSYLLVVFIAFDAPWVLLALNGALLAVSPVGTVLGGAAGPALLPVLGATGRTQMVTGALLALGLALNA